MVRALISARVNVNVPKGQSSLDSLATQRSSCRHTHVPTPKSVAYPVSRPHSLTSNGGVTGAGNAEIRVNEPLFSWSLIIYKIQRYLDVKGQVTWNCWHAMWIDGLRRLRGSPCNLTQSKTFIAPGFPKGGLYFRLGRPALTCPPPADRPMVEGCSPLMFICRKIIAICRAGSEKRSVERHGSRRESRYKRNQLRHIVPPRGVDK